MDSNITVSTADASDDYSQSQRHTFLLLSVSGIL